MSIAATFDDAPPEANEHVRTVVGGVVLVLAAWNLLGWLVGIGWDKPVAYMLAAMTLGFELLAFNASVQMRRAHAKALPRAQFIWTATLAMCSGWSVYSAHHALGVFAPMPQLDVVTLDSVLGLLAAAPAVVVLTVAAVVVPWLPWAIETVEAAPRQRPKAPVETTVETPAPQQPRRASKEASRRVASELKRTAPQRAPRSETPGQAERASETLPLTETALKQAVAELTRRGEVVSIRSVARACGVSPSRIHRFPNRREIMAVAA